MQRLLTLVIGGFVGMAMYRRWQLAQQANEGVKEMVPDFAGNYDIDGVSYDESAKRVVVGSDGHASKPTKSSGLSQVECAEKLERALAKLEENHRHAS